VLLVLAAYLGEKPVSTVDRVSPGLARLLIQLEPRRSSDAQPRHRFGWRREPDATGLHYRIKD